MLVFVRHAPVLVDGLCYGQADVPTVSMRDLGEELQVCVAEIASHVDGRPLSILSSPSPRTVELAEYLAAVLPGSGAPRLDARLLEISMGDWEGRSFADIEVEDRERFEHWMRYWKSVAPPRGETLEQFVERVGECLAALPKREDWLIVTHAGAIRAYWVLTGAFDWEGAMHQRVSFLGVVAFAPSIDCRPSCKTRARTGL